MCPRNPSRWQDRSANANSARPSPTLHHPSPRESRSASMSIGRVITATPFSEANGQGLGGVPLTVRVTVQQ